MVGHRKPRDKTYEDYLALPEGVKAELIDGELFMTPPPRGRHVRIASLLGIMLGSRFGLAAGAGPQGPGGWWILDEPECHLLPDRRVVVPDIAGWRRERMPRPPSDTHKFTLVPDWVCEVLSPSTASRDAIIKMPKYLEAGVQWAWIVDPIAQRVDVYRAGEGEWVEAGAIEGDGVLGLPPFEAAPIDFAVVWAEG